MTTWKLVSVSITAVVLMTLSAAARPVGTATAVNPASESTPPGGLTVALTVDAHVVHKERIHRRRREAFSFSLLTRARSASRPIPAS